MATSLTIPSDLQAKLLLIFPPSAQIIAVRIFTILFMWAISLATPFSECLPVRTR